MTNDNALDTTRKVWSFQFSYTESIVGEAFGTSEDEVRNNLVHEFGHAKDFKIDLIEESPDHPAAAQLDLPYQLN